MISKIIPVIKPCVDWNMLGKNAEFVLGYNPLKAADATDRELSDHARLLAVLSAFQDRSKDNPIRNIRNASSVLKHLRFGFMVAGDRQTILEISAATELILTVNVNTVEAVAAIISGDLNEWRAASIEHCVPEAPYSVRLFFDQIVLYFQKIGLGEVWSDYRKIDNDKDKTFFLEVK